MPSLHNLIKNLAAQKPSVRVKSPPAPAPKKQEKAQPLRDVLYGSGIRKRDLERKPIIIESVDSHIEASASARAALLDGLGEVPDTMATGIILDESQQAAVDGLIESRCGCMIGPAGSGKTTTEKALIEALGITEAKYALTRADEELIGADSEAATAFKQTSSIAMVSFTGKAVQQSKRALPRWMHPYCDTGHGWLGYAPEYIEKIGEDGEVKVVRIFRPTFTEQNKLSVKILIIDEAGMMPIYLYNQLVRALPDDTRIYCIGDINQLAPVHGRSVLGFAMLKWPTFELKKIHRTDEGSIIDNAHRILRGFPVIADNRTTAKREIEASSSKAQLEIVRIMKYLYEKGSFDPMQDALITPQNVGPLGQEELNRHLVRVFNPVRYQTNTQVPINPRTTIKTARETLVYSVGDKVMLLKNKRDLGLTNGQVGVVMEIRHNGRFQGAALDTLVLENDLFSANGSFSLDDFDDDVLNVADVPQDEDESERAASHIMTVKFQNVEEPLELSSTGDFSGIAHAYAMTCHKMQGSEARKVIIICHSTHLNMLCREWYYTALTRAQERVTVLYTQRGEKHAITSQRLKGQTLEEKARSFIEASGREDIELPILPDPAL